MGDLQLSLFQWGMWYKGINEMPMSDKPADSIIENDAKLDRWYERWQREIARKSSRGGRGDPNFSLLQEQDTVPQFRG